MTSSTAAADTSNPNPSASSSAIPSGAGHAKKSLVKLTVGAIGVVYGDIGTSPLYAFREAFTGAHKLPVDKFHILGVLSMMLWSLMLVVTIKYVMITLKADNKGEGGSFALLSLLTRTLPGGTGKQWVVPLTLLGVMATALFYGDAMITPAISVLGAVEGLRLLNPHFGPLVVPFTLIVVIFLFLIQRKGTASVGALFGPITLVYFITIATLGVIQIMKQPQVLWALSPLYAAQFVIGDPLRAFFTLGSVVLAVTGAEALYADMGHFGRNPIKIAWTGVVFPALILNYLGQSALVLREPGAIADVFYHMAPPALLLPLLILATMAAVIASQAVISGAYSVTQQAIQLGYLPRMSILHTSATELGQIYLPAVNWSLLVCVVILVLGFQSSDNLGAAYGLAVTGTMLITTVMLALMVFRVWKWNKLYAVPLFAIIFTMDLGLFASSATKIVAGGWFPLMIGLMIFTLLTTWKRGRSLVQARLNEGAMPLELFIKSACASATRVPRTAVFLTNALVGVPSALLHNLKHNMVLHERTIFLTVTVEDVPAVSDAKRIEITDLTNGFYRVMVHYGFMDQPDLPKALAQAAAKGLPFKMMDTSFFLSRQTILASDHPGMAVWREHLFTWMNKGAVSAMEFFRLPTNRVVELGSQVEI